MRTADDRGHEQQLDARAEPRRTAPARAVALSCAALALALALALGGLRLLQSWQRRPGDRRAGLSAALHQRHRPPDRLAQGQVNAVANKLHISNLSGALVKLVDKSPASDNLTYEQNFKPWLGQRVAFFA